MTWDEEFIYRNVSPPFKKEWSDQFCWKDVERICFEATDFLESDNLYFFTKGRDESYVIPIEAKGGNELWNIILDKELFDAEQALRAMTSVGGLFCWPEFKESEEES